MAFGSESEDSGTVAEAKGSDAVMVDGPVKKSPRKEYFCTVAGCDKSFSRPWRLEAHEYVHSGVAPFPCNVAGCDKRYTSRNHLTRHMKTSHYAKETKLIPCPFEGCKVQLKTNQNVKKHYKRAHVDKVCPTCGKSYTNKTEFKYHMQFHTGNFLYECEQCDLKFSRKTEYGRHMRGHKIHCCPFKGCDLAFETWTLVRKHQTSHRSRYICYYCRKPYNKRQTFRYHVQTHMPDGQKRKTVLKKFTCFYCNATVCGKQSLRRHIKNVHLNPRKWSRKPSLPRAPRRDKGSLKDPVLPLSSVLSEVPCSSEMAKTLVSSYEPVFYDIVEISSVIHPDFY